MMKRVRELGGRWRTARVSRVGLGKYVILMACLLHVAWAILLRFPGAEFATPVAMVVQICGGPGRAAIVLVAVAVAAVVFPFRRYGMSPIQMSLHLIPQQVVLLFSAGAGVRAIALGHYADGVHRPWAFIAVDQMAIILLALLYTAVVFEAARGLAARRRERLGEDA